MTRPQPFDDARTLSSLRWNISAERVILAGLRLMVALERRAHFDPAQPRDDFGRWTDGGGSPSARIVDPDGTKPAREGRVRVAGPFDDGPVDLRWDGDIIGGHPVERHVGKSDEELVALALANLTSKISQRRGDARAGTFDSIDRANELVNEALGVASPTVYRVASKAVPARGIYVKFGRVTGREAVISIVDGKLRYRSTYGVGIFLIHDPGSSRGFRIHSAYPMNFD